MCERCRRGRSFRKMSAGAFIVVASTVWLTCSSFALSAEVNNDSCCFLGKRKLALNLLLQNGQVLQQKFETKRNLDSDV